MIFGMKGMIFLIAIIPHHDPPTTSLADTLICLTIFSQHCCGSCGHKWNALETASGPNEDTKNKQKNNNDVLHSGALAPELYPTE